MGDNDQLFTKRIKSSYKNFFFNVRQGKRGCYVIVAESVPKGGGKFEKNSILVGEDDLKLFRDIFDEIIEELRKRAA